VGGALSEPDIFRKLPGASPRPQGQIVHLCADARFRAEQPLLAPGNPVKVQQRRVNGES
jgi:hypothetical protein